ncbi:MAG: 4-(cytidine 5'-diphospho)-2-C-methyl-D-erythritol kinase [Bacteroidales bacterium]
MIFFPNAKINIGLYITHKRSDGYHNLETVFYPLSLTDILEIQQRKDNPMTFNNTGIHIPGPLEENLCYKASKLLQQHHPVPEINFHLHKIIPYGSGLGGGSSDASFTLKALNHLFQLNLTTHKLKDMAEQLGSDCPFFIDNTPSLAREKGNETTPIHLSIKGFYLLLVIPEIQIDTQTAYMNIKPRERQKSLKEIVLNQPVENWQEEVTNDFENNLLKEYPLLDKIKQRMKEMGAVFTSLSGSGSAMYGIFKEKPLVIAELKQHFIWMEQLKY